MTEIDDFFLKIEDYKIHVLRQCKNVEFPWVIFLHDALGCVESWRSFPSDVLQDLPFNMVVYSRRGHGKSDSLPQDKGIDIFEKETQELSALVNLLGLDQIILVGSSDGGTIALQFAAQFPVLGIVSIAGHYMNEKETFEGVGNAKKEPFNAHLRMALRKYHDDNTDRMVDSWQNIWTNDVFRTWSIEDMIKDISCPALILQGKNDEYASDNHALQLGELIHSSEVHLLEELGHFPHKENPDLTKKLIIEFLKRIES